MKVYELAVKQFGPLRDITIQLANERVEAVMAPHLNVIYGDDQGGKTALLFAFSMALLGPSIINAHNAPILDIKTILGLEGLTISENDQAEFTVKLIDEHSTIKVISFFIYYDGDDLCFECHHNGEPATDMVVNEDVFLIGYGRRRNDLMANLQTDFALVPGVKPNEIQSLLNPCHHLITAQKLFDSLSEQPIKRSQVLKIINRVLDDHHSSIKLDLHNGVVTLLTEKSASINYFGEYGLINCLSLVADLLYRIAQHVEGDKSITWSNGLVLIDDIENGLTTAAACQLIEILHSELPNTQFFVTTSDKSMMPSEEMIELKNDHYSYIKKLTLVY